MKRHVNGEVQCFVVRDGVNKEGDVSGVWKERGGSVDAVNACGLYVTVSSGVTFDVGECVTKYLLSSELLCT